MNGITEGRGGGREAVKLTPRHSPDGAASAAKVEGRPFFPFRHYQSTTRTKWSNTESQRGADADMDADASGRDAKLKGGMNHVQLPPTEIIN